MQKEEQDTCVLRLVKNRASRKKEVREIARGHKVKGFIGHNEDFIF